MFHDVSRFEGFIPRQAPDSLADLDQRLRIFADDSIEVWYSPMGTGPEDPMIWILGITPGWRQMKIAYQGAVEALDSGADTHTAAQIPKPKVAFAGSMRANLVAMLDELGLHWHTETSSSARLFGSTLLRTGSVLKFPVFRNGKNYTGHAPKPLRHSVLLEMIDVVLAGELDTVSKCLIVPLGNAVESVLQYSVDRGRLDERRVLSGFPHPSGANGHRIRQFQANKHKLRTTMKEWYRNVA